MKPGLYGFRLESKYSALHSSLSSNSVRELGFVKIQWCISEDMSRLEKLGCQDLKADLSIGTIVSCFDTVVSQLLTVSE